MSGVNNYRRGQKAPSGELEHLLGNIKFFDDVDMSAASLTKPLLSGAKVRCRWVKNASGGTLTARQVCEWKTGYFGTRIGSAADASDIAAGVVDEYAGTVADGEHFWLVQEGPGQLISDGNGVLAEGDVVNCIGTNTGKVRAGSFDSDTVGTVLDATVAAEDNTTFRAHIKLPHW